MGRRWYVVQTHEAKDTQAWVALTEMNIVTVFLQEPKQIKRGRSTVIVLRAMIPGYIFAKFDREADDWGRILRARGVYTVLGLVRHSGFHQPAGSTGFSGQPSAVPEGIVERLDEHAQAIRIEAYRQPGDKPAVQPLTIGQAVDFVDGPFADVSRLVQAFVLADMGTRVRLLVDILGHSITTIVRRDSLVPAAGCA